MSVESPLVTVHQVHKAFGETPVLTGLSLLWARNVPVVLTLAAREDWTCGDGDESSSGNNPLEALEKWAAAERDEIKEHLASIIGALGEP